MTRTSKLTARQQQVFELLQRAIERTGFPPTRAEIAAELGFSSANSAEEHLRALARKGVIELAAGSSRGIRLISEAARSDELPHQFTLPHPSIMQLSLPLVGRVAAGSPILAQEHISQHYACDPALFSSKPDYLLKVRGLSMRDAGILDGDLLAVQKRTEAKDGQIVVARLGDDVTVKRWKRRSDGVELIAENPDYENIFVRSGSGEFALEGIAVGLIRSGEF
ncbi:transcriptional repressor LexA [Caballeronia sp. LZ019]|uniref:transcriptional repressor LexA n=1 Tax=Caballeronia sp. LZ019 TaxID=3038555 RepID=UPI002863D0D9|nr:transcriptional repressor LexA [Caballeronia sp. LZ019]MDR5811653.1 transcriptional repressor LexA [Caballeronia sp. LZ019]